MKHCCPKGTLCSVEGGKCIKSDSSVDRASFTAIRVSLAAEVGIPDNVQLFHVNVNTGLIGLLKCGTVKHWVRTVSAVSLSNNKW